MSFGTELEKGGFDVAFLISGLANKVKMVGKSCVLDRSSKLYFTTFFSIVILFFG